METPRVKVCGITNLADAQAVVAAGADALGFVFYAKSPRCVTAETVAEIVAALPPFVTTVGLFVNAGQEVISSTMMTAGLDVAQLHGDETPADCRLAPWRTIKALRVKNADSLHRAADYPVSALLLDAWSDDAYGGTGKQFDWQLVQQLNSQCPVILAGGLNPDNVAAAIATAKPYAVDVSSGVELSPGRKDIEKVNKFIQQVRNA